MTGSQNKGRRADDLVARHSAGAVQCVGQCRKEVFFRIVFSFCDKPQNAAPKLEEGNQTAEECLPLIFRFHHRNKVIGPSPDRIRLGWKESENIRNDPGWQRGCKFLDQVNLLSAFEAFEEL